MRLEGAGRAPQIPVETRGWTPRKPLVAFLSGLALAGSMTAPAIADEAPSFKVTSSKPQKTIHSKAEKIIVPPELDAVAGCESGTNDPDSAGDYTRESDDPRSDASGRYQIKNATWRYLGGKGRAKNAPPWKQDKLAVKLYKLQGLRPWYASRHCWAGKVALIRERKSKAAATSAVVARIGTVSAAGQVVALSDRQPAAHLAVAGHQPAKHPAAAAA